MLTAGWRGGAATFPATGSFFSSLGAVLEQWAKGVNIYICTWKGCPLPATEKEQIYENLSQVFCSVAGNWLDCQEEEVRTAVSQLGMAAGMPPTVPLSVPSGLAAKGPRLALCLGLGAPCGEAAESQGIWAGRVGG